MTGNELFQDEILTEFARIGKAVSSPARLRILSLLMAGEKPVELLARLAQLSVANASQHLQLLKATRLVESRKEGQKVQYRLSSPTVKNFWQALQEFGKERLLEVRDLVTCHEKRWARVPHITSQQLIGRGKKTAAVVDVRPVPEFRAAHIPGAVNIPLANLEKWAGANPRAGKVVVYCQGGFSTLSFQGAALLAEKGIAAEWLEGGFLEWEAAGLPTEGAGGASA